jgi:hypothetical protein
MNWHLPLMVYHGLLADPIQSGHMRSVFLHDIFQNTNFPSTKG